MKLVDIKINNFRGIQKLIVPVDDLTVLIGENNTGKSTILEAIRIVIDNGLPGLRNDIFHEYDFHLSETKQTPQDADPISIILHFAEKQENEWSDTIHQQFVGILQPDADTNLNHLWLSVSGKYN
jgi:putative ATP-dependent endonuclease of OLD family